MAYHITGLISAAIFLLTIGGLWTQCQLIFKRNKAFGTGNFAQRPTAILSLNQFVSSFLAFYSFFLYGACLQRFNHYLVWPRLVATLLTLVVLYEIMRDRREPLSVVSFLGCAAFLLAAPALLMFHPDSATSAKLISQVLIVVATVILAQGYLHQVIVIRQSGLTGAVSLRMHQCFLLKDLATIAFAWTMGVADGWPLLLLSAVSAITKMITIWHFRWARLSPLAQARRERSGASVAEIPFVLG